MIATQEDDGSDPPKNQNRIARYRWVIWVALSAIGVNWHAYVYMAKNPANLALVGLTILNLLGVILFFLGRMTISGSKKRLDKWLGEITYPLYLNHYAASIAVLSLMPAEQRGSLLFVSNLIACISISLALSYISEPLTRSIRNRIRGASV